MDIIDTTVQDELNRNDGVKPKTKKRAKPKPKAKKRAKPKAKAKKRKLVPYQGAPKSAPVRSERLDMRLTKSEKAKVVAKAKKTRRTVTSLVIEAIEKIK